MRPRRRPTGPLSSATSPTVNPDLVIHLGDLSFNGARNPADLEHARRQLGLRGAVARRSGNHDVVTIRCLACRTASPWMTPAGSDGSMSWARTGGRCGSAAGCCLALTPSLSNPGWRRRLVSGPGLASRSRRQVRACGSRCCRISRSPWPRRNSLPRRPTGSGRPRRGIAPACSGRARLPGRQRPRAPVSPAQPWRRRSRVGAHDLGRAARPGAAGARQQASRGHVADVRARPATPPRVCRAGRHQAAHLDRGHPGSVPQPLRSCAMARAKATSRSQVLRQPADPSDARPAARRGPRGPSPGPAQRATRRSAARSLSAYAAVALKRKRQVRDQHDPYRYHCWAGLGAGQ